MFENIKDNIEIKKLENKISKAKFFYYQLADKAQKENKGRNEMK